MVLGPGPKGTCEEQYKVLLVKCVNPTCNEWATYTAGFFDQIGYKLYWSVTLLTLRECTTCQKVTLVTIGIG